MPYLQCALEKQCLGMDSIPDMSYFTTSFSFILLLLNIPGNLLVILAVALDPYKNLRTPFNYLMANLAFADLIVGTVTEPMSIYIHWKEATDDHVTQVEAGVLHMSYFISCTASVLSLGTLAVERYIAIRYPHTYRNKFTKKRVILTALGIWIISLGLPCVYFEVGYVTYAFIFVNTAVAVTIGIICFMYYLMLRALKQRARSDTPTAFVHKITDSTEHEVTEPSHHQHSAKWEHKITKRFLVVLIFLLCCYGPSTVFIYTMTFCRSCSCVTLHWLRDLQFLFVIANSSVNFFCYALRSSRFRKAFAHFLKMKTQEVAQGSGTRMADSSTDIMNV